MTRSKKIFTCGHKGLGQLCDRCAITETVLADKRKQKQEWDATFDNDPIDLSFLPPHLVLKARHVIGGLQNHQNYRDFGGKRLRHNRCIISIPLNRDYRMICHDCGSMLIPQSVLSHEEYNVRKPGG